MKRTFASLVSAFIVFGVATPAFARSFNATRWSQARVSARAWKRAAIASYQHRGNLAYRRERYRNVIAGILRSTPSTLAVTGSSGRNHADYQIINRPTARRVSTWRLPDHCDVRFGGRVRMNAVESNPSAKNPCTQADE